MTNLTDQQVFDKVVAHLLRQGRQSRSGIDFGCAYRSDDGLKCAIGCLIPDDVYIPQIEGFCLSGSNLEKNTLWSSMFVQVFADGGLTEVNVDLLRNLQNVHDGNNNAHNEWPDLLWAVGRRYGLDLSSFRQTFVYHSVDLSPTP